MIHRIGSLGKRSGRLNRMYEGNIALIYCEGMLGSSFYHKGVYALGSTHWYLSAFVHAFET